MISGVVVGPAAPWLIPGLSDVMAGEQSALRAELVAATSRLVACSSSVLLLISGESDSWHGPMPDDLGPSPYGAIPASSDWPGGAHVGAAVIVAAPGPRPTVWVQQVPTDRRGELTHARHRVAGGEPIGLLVLTEGSRCHGDDAPGREDPRSAAFDQSLHRALADGWAACSAWARTQQGLGAELGSSAPWLLAATTMLCESAELRRSVASDGGAPYGVGYHVAQWWPE